MNRPSVNIPGMNVVVLFLAGGLAIASYLAGTRTEPGLSTSVSSGSSVSIANWPDMRIDLNLADEAELTLLPGIGPALARRIVEYRLRNGSYEVIEELTRVDGIGLRTVQKLRDFAVISPPRSRTKSGDDEVLND